MDAKSRRKSPVNVVTTEPHYCSIDLRLRILGRLPFFAGLSPASLQRVNQSFSEIGYAPGETIYAAGDPADRLFVIAEGKVKLIQPTLAGKNQLLDFFGSGDFFGNLVSLGSEYYSDTAIAQTPGCILCIRSEDFRTILDENSGLALRALEVLAARLNESNQRITRLSTMPVEKRVASSLLKLVKKFGKEKEGNQLIDLPLSRNDLAEMTGTTPETVSRIMSQMQNDGIILSGRQWVAISDISALESLATVS